jgi:hypothetical protein
MATWVEKRELIGKLNRNIRKLKSVSESVETLAVELCEYYASLPRVDMSWQDIAHKMVEDESGATLIENAGVTICLAVDEMKREDLRRFARHVLQIGGEDE